MIIFYDWETDDLNIPDVPSDDPRQPNGLELSAILDDDNGVTRAVMSTLIKPVREVPAEVTAIHGITTEIAERYGRPLGNVMSDFAEMVECASILSAFNHHFDFKFVKISCAKLVATGCTNMRPFFETRSKICVQHPSLKAVKHLGGPYMKPLGEVYHLMFGRQFTGAHRSLADAMAARDIYYRLKEMGALPEPKPLARFEPAPAETAA